MRAVCDFRPDSGMRAARELLGSAHPPDALFCVNDQMAIAAMEVAKHEFGLRIGDDISIIGFDDTGMSAWPSFSLTTYSQPAEHLATQTIALLARLMETPDAGASHIVVPGDLIIRKSARIPKSWSR
jgi:DNA-binding LacI/PurR family transcriptional regulator